MTMVFILRGRPAVGRACFIRVKWKPMIHLFTRRSFMKLEHMNIILLNKNFLSEVGLRLLIYAQLAREVSGMGNEKRIIFLSRRRICKRLSISMGACRSAIRQLIDYGFISMCDSRGNKIEDFSSNFIFINPKEKLNHIKIKSVLDLIEKTKETNAGSVNDSAVGLFDEILSGRNT